ncbi:hypothetical protein WOLCODRAFT_20136 [Wolfiporia cocos MD-104 SS10]|uniref:Clp1-like protein n=1 Tax=Wolfiporia cocos (strain MD-104) TaxID=742152 RepID=A0A2H3J0N6_WOLCO|nr:hypothetical protein WOLCODRAFT_20136 [Wolfiporia cocos MD-104 SS10]
MAPIVSSATAAHKTRTRQVRSQPKAIYSIIGDGVASYRKVPRDRARAAAKRRTMTAVSTFVTHSHASTEVTFDVTGKAPPPPCDAGLPESERTRIAIRLPRQLQRPHKRVLTNTKVVQIDSTLGKVPIEYVQDKLAELGPTMARVVAHSAIDAAITADTVVPRRVRVRLGDISAEPPTHVFAVHERTPAARRSTVSLVPTHDIVWAANSATLPELGRPRRAPPPALAPGSEITLPVVPVRVADVPAFPTFMEYVYNKRADLLLARLLPDTAPDAAAQTAPRAIVAYAEQLAATCPVPALLHQVRVVRGVWANAAAFGVYDAGLWAALDLAWEIILHALAFATGTSLDEMDSVRLAEEDDMTSTPPPPRHRRRRNEPAGAPALGQ